MPAFGSTINRLLLEYYKPDCIERNIPSGLLGIVWQDCARGGNATVSVSDILSELSDSQAQKLTTSNFLVGLDDASIDHDSSSTSVAQRITISSYSPSARTVTLYYATSYNSSSISAYLYVFYAK